MRFILQCILIFGYLLATSSQIVKSSDSSSEVTSNPFDILIFTQHWPITVCLAWKEQEPDHSCVLPTRNDIWTVHGIWPTKLGTMGPTFCNNSWPFDPKQLAAIEPQLEQYWGNVHTGSRYVLWEHEWDKHGTCAAQLTTLHSEADYFGQGLKWIAQYNMNAVLSKAGILPESEHDALELSNAVHTALGKDAGIECITDRKTGRVYLFEIRICFDKELQLTDCDGIRDVVNETSLISNCPHGKLIYYPGSASERQINNFSFGIMHGHEPARSKMRWLLTVLEGIQWVQWFTL